MKEKKLKKLDINCCYQDEVSNWIESIGDATISIKQVDKIELNYYASQIIKKLDLNEVNEFIIWCDEQDEVIWMQEIDISMLKDNQVISREFLYFGYDLIVDRIFNGQNPVFFWTNTIQQHA